MIEHPDKATWKPSHPSSWLIPQTANFVGTGLAKTARIDQCMCGAPSKKPARLLHVNLESFDDRLAQLPNAGRCNHGRDGHTVTLKGVDSNGRFLTSPAKEYPPDFSSFIASVFSDFIVRFVEPPSETVEGTLPDLEEHARFYMPLDPYLGAHAAGQFGEDFATSNYLTVSEKRKAEKK